MSQISATRLVCSGLPEWPRTSAASWSIAAAIEATATSVPGVVPCRPTAPVLEYTGED
jgi:hypothetical protein